MEENEIMNDEVEETEEIEDTEEKTGMGFGAGVTFGAILTVAGIAAGKKVKSVWQNHKAKKALKEAERSKETKTSNQETRNGLKRGEYL